jgi:hypothetical protein
MKFGLLDSHTTQELLAWYDTITTIIIIIIIIIKSCYIINVYTSLIIENTTGMSHLKIKGDQVMGQSSAFIFRVDYQEEAFRTGVNNGGGGEV